MRPAKKTKERKSQRKDPRVTTGSRRRVTRPKFGQKVFVIIIHLLSSTDYSRPMPIKIKPVQSPSLDTPPLSFLDSGDAIEKNLAFPANGLASFQSVCSSY